MPGRLRPLRFFWVVIVYLTCEALLLVVMFGLWIASGFGWRLRTPYFEGIHYDLVQGTMWVFFREARRVLRLTIESEGPGPLDAPPAGRSWSAAGTPGPGDSFVLIHTLMAWYDREPRVVLKDTLAWDPMISVVLNRIPARFITPNPGPDEDLEAQIAELATGLDENDAFVIFPEGGNFTPQRRQKAIDRLRRLGMERMAQRAEQMIHVLAPRPGGFLAALDAAPGRRRRAGRAHRPGPHGHRRRGLARAADGQADHHALVADPARRDPGRPRGADRVALRLVGADRRLDRREPAGGDLHRPVLTRRAATSASSTSTTSAGSSGVVTGCGDSAWSAIASPARRRPRRPRSPSAPGWAPASGAGVGEYDDCQLSLSLPPLRRVATNAAAGRDAGEQHQLLSLLPFFFLGSATSATLSAAASAPAAAFSAAYAAPSAIFSAATAAPAAIAGPALSRASARYGAALALASAMTGPPCSCASASDRAGLVAGRGDRGLELRLDLVDVLAHRVAGLVEDRLVLPQTHGASSRRVPG